jgi:succinyl-diaminopimelate desuccinylase
LLDYCIVGEPTAVDRLGDTVKNGRRGSLSGKLTVKRHPGPHRLPAPGEEPDPPCGAGHRRTRRHWSGIEGNEYFPPTTWQISNIHGGTGASNVIPGSVDIEFNFRFGSASLPERLQARLCEVLDRQGLDYEIVWTLGARPFLTSSGTLIDAALLAIDAETGVEAELSTTGGTSDGRFITSICPQVVEIGPVNASIHKVNECVEVATLAPLSAIYRRILEQLLPAHV